MATRSLDGVMNRPLTATQRAEVEAGARFDAAVSGRGVPVEPGALRASLGFTQDVVAERMGVSRGRVAQIESEREPRVATVRAYIEALGGRLELTAVFDDRVVRLA